MELNPATRRALGAELLHSATVGGAFMQTAAHASEPNASALDETVRWNAGGVRFHYDLRDSLRVRGLQFFPSLLAALDREAAGEAPLPEDAAALHGLRNKSLLFLGDSIDGNVWTRLCHCRRENGPRYASSVIGNVTRDKSRVRCISGAQHGAFAGIYLSDDFKTCDYRRLGLSLHYSDAAYGLHPYGAIYQRDAAYLPNCSTLSLERCYIEKWLRSSNARAGFAAMHGGLVRSPDVLIVNVNMWYWLKKRWLPKSRLPTSLQAGLAHEYSSWTSAARSFQRNATRLLCALRHLLPRTQLLSLHTTPLPHYLGEDATQSGEVISARRSTKAEAIKQTAHTNAAIRSLATRLGLPYADWEAMLHLGWARRRVLDHGPHPLETFNAAVATIYLNTLRWVSDGADDAPSTGAGSGMSLQLERGGGSDAAGACRATSAALGSLPWRQHVVNAAKLEPDGTAARQNCSHDLTNTWAAWGKVYGTICCDRRCKVCGGGGCSAPGVRVAGEAARYRCCLSGIKARRRRLFGTDGELCRSADDTGCLIRN